MRPVNTVCTRLAQTRGATMHCAALRFAIQMNADSLLPDHLPPQTIV